MPCEISSSIHDPTSALRAQDGPEHRLPKVALEDRRTHAGLYPCATAATVPAGAGDAPLRRSQRHVSASPVVRTHSCRGRDRRLRAAPSSNTSALCSKVPTRAHGTHAASDSPGESYHRPIARRRP